MKNGVNISGATNASYTTPPTTAADNGSLFAVVVGNVAGSVTSNNAILTVTSGTPTHYTDHNSYSHAYGQGDCYCDTYSNCNFNAHAYSNCNANTNTYTLGDSNRSGDY